MVKRGTLQPQKQIEMDRLKVFGSSSNEKAFQNAAFYGSMGFDPTPTGVAATSKEQPGWRNAVEDDKGVFFRWPKSKIGGKAPAFGANIHGYGITGSAPNTDPMPNAWINVGMGNRLGGASATAPGASTAHPNNLPAPGSHVKVIDFLWMLTEGPEDKIKQAFGLDKLKLPIEEMGPDLAAAAAAVPLPPAAALNTVPGASQLAQVNRWNHLKWQQSSGATGEEDGVGWTSGGSRPAEGGIGGRR